MTKRYWYISVIVAAICIDLAVWIAPHWTTPGRLAMTGAVIFITSLLVAVSRLPENE